MDDKVLSTAVIPYIRSRNILIQVAGLKPNTRFYPFFDKIPVKDYVKPADVFKVTRVSNSLMNFDLYDLQNNVLADDPRRSVDGTEYRTIVGETGGRTEPAFGIGDIISNTTHSAVNIVSISNLTSAATTFTLVVSDTNNLFVGNHVVLYNLNYHNSMPVTNWQDYSGTVIPVSNKLTNPAASSKQLNFRKFKIVAINGGTLTLANIDNSSIEAFDAWYGAKSLWTFGYGANFDIVLMESAYAAVGKKEPWKYFDIMCMRTICNLLNSKCMQVL